jgi:hypothetical protein
VSAGPTTAVRRWVSDPLVPLAVLAAGGLALVLTAVAPVATWAVLGGLAGYALSGSV